MKLQATACFRDGRMAESDVDGKMECFQPSKVILCFVTRAYLSV